MKTFRLVGMVLIAVLITACSDGGDEQDTTIDTSVITVAGTLRESLGDQYREITALKVIGSLNGDDIRIIREMGGSDYKGNSTKGKLSYLDLSDASIVEGGDYYHYDDYYDCYDYTFNDEIGDYMFRDCSRLKTITLPNSITGIGDWAFSGCTGLTSINIPNSTDIGDYAFQNCIELTSINIPDSTTIGYHAFEGCRGLTIVNIPNGIISIEPAAFRDCTGLTSITIPNSFISIGRSAFENCTGLTSITIGSGVIGDRAFSGCTGLTNITIGNGGFTIADGAFEDCTGLTSITIGSGITTIGDYAFSKCPIKKCHIYATTPPLTSTNAFSNNTVYAKSTLYVPKGCVEIYKKAGWETHFYNIVEMD